MYLLSSISSILILIILNEIKFLSGMQSNNTCGQSPKDKRQMVCVCGKQLQLRCTFNLDIREIEPRDLDRALKPIYMTDVSIEREINPDDPDDINKDFKDRKKLESNNRSPLVYLYFPNFSVLDSPYIRISFIRFVFVPTFAFADKVSFLQAPNANYQMQYKSIASIVFELQDVFDFGIDKYAFFGVESEDLIIEGPFNQMTIHEDAFEYSRITELVIGCYCIECETFIGDCKVMFGQKSIRTTFPYSKSIFNKIQSNGTSSSSSSNIKSIKLFGVQVGNDASVWNLDNLPNINEINYLEISNLVSVSANSATQQKQEDFLDEIKSVKYNQLSNLNELHLKNNGFKNLKLKLLRLFSNLTKINLAQNQLEHIDMDAFQNNKYLAELYLERNRLKLLNKLVFNRLTNLRILNIKENLIEFIEDNTFSQLKNLEYLDLTRNKITHLTKSTFNGLVNLRELLLSYNPLKKLETNTFKQLGLESPLARLDLISNTESDWFVFDDSDICLLSYFKCETQIHIDIDQRCNCFVKYLNEIGKSRMYSINMDRFNGQVDSSDSDSTWFQPCSISDSQNLPANIDLDQRKYLKYSSASLSSFASSSSSSSADYPDLFENYVHYRDPAQYNNNNNNNNVNKPLNGESGSNENHNAKILCSKMLLRKCYSTELGRDLDVNGADDHLFNGSCLFNKFLAKAPPTTTTTTTTTTSTTTTSTTSTSTTTTTGTPTSTTPTTTTATISNMAYLIGSTAHLPMLNDKFNDETDKFNVNDNKRIENKNLDTNNNHLYHHQANLQKDNIASAATAPDAEADYNPNELIKVNTKSGGAHHHHNKLNDPVSLNDLTQTIKHYTIENNLLYIIIGISVVFVISTLSLFIAIYLLIKRNTFVYHPTSMYPADER